MAKEVIREISGFEGSVAGLSLADVIQLNSNNGFSGCITVQYGMDTGRLFFREGKVIHAEQGGKSGEEAFYDIMEWRTGHFNLDTNVSTTSYSIKKSAQFLLLEACRVIDERKAGRSHNTDPSRREESKSARAGIAERLRTVPGVTYAVLMGGNGSCVDDATTEGESLAGKAAYLAFIGNQLGAILQAGPLRFAAAHVGDPAYRVLVLVGKDHYLTVLVGVDTDLSTAEASVRKVVGEGY